MLGPYFTAKEDLDLKRCRKDFQTTQTKARWGRIGMETRENIGIIVQYSTIQYNTLQYTTTQYGTLQYSTVQYSTI